jgi:uncharacterized membrane protein
MKSFLSAACIGLLVLILAACAESATSTPVIPDSATEISASPANTVVPATATSTLASTAEVSFADDVMPILNNSCTKCHGGEQVKEGLNMTSYSNLMAGSFNGPVIIIGNAGKSLLIDMVAKGKMPKRGAKLTAEQIQIIVNWINAGALNN